MTKIVYEITSASWWKAASIRALRTAISVLLPFLLAGSILDVDWEVAASTVGLATILSYATSLVGLKEVTGDGVPRHVALGIRAIKQFFQTLVSFIGTSVLLTDVDWYTALVLSISATVVTLLQSLLLELPEAEDSFTGDPKG